MKRGIKKINLVLLFYYFGEKLTERQSFYICFLWSAYGMVNLPFRNTSDRLK